MKPILIILGIVLALSEVADAKSDAPIVTRLYQVGKNGKYCVSVTPDESRCVSGVDESGKPYNHLDTIEGEYVIFENLSDAPHDMVFTGNNQERLPAQFPNAEKAEKVLRVSDLKGAMINCSYHGKMLSVGYKVREGKLDDSAPINGHQKSATPFAAPGVNQSANAPTRPLVTTGLADVGSEVIARGDAKDVENLLKARPELLGELVETRPLLAKELIAKGITEDPLQGGVGDPGQQKLKNILADEALAAALANGTLTPEQLAQVKGLTSPSQVNGNVSASRIGFNERGERTARDLGESKVQFGNQTLRVTGLGNAGPKENRRRTGLSLALGSLADEARRFAKTGSEALGLAREPASFEEPHLAAFDSPGTRAASASGFGFFSFLALGLATGALVVFFYSRRKRKEPRAETKPQPGPHPRKAA